MKYFKALLLCVLMSSVMYAQGGLTIKDLGPDLRKGKPPGILDRGTSSVNSLAKLGVKSKPTQFPKSTSAASWVIVDSMTNILGMWTDRGNPFDYNEKLDVFTFVHRSDRINRSTSRQYVPGSTTELMPPGYDTLDITAGDMWYNYSTNGGTTWPRVGPLNSTDPIYPFGRYPSGSIFAPTSDMADH